MGEALLMTVYPSPTPALAHIRVGDCMHTGILSCSTDAPLGEVAGMMAQHRIHAVAVIDGPGRRPIGVVSDMDVVAAAASGGEPDALHAAATESLTVSAGESLQRAAQLMIEHGVSHLVVVDAADGHAIGVLSTLDVASVYALDGKTAEAPA